MVKILSRRVGLSLVKSTLIGVLGVDNYSDKTRPIEETTMQEESIFLLIRPKKGKILVDRVNSEIVKSPIFTRMRQEIENFEVFFWSKVIPVAGLLQSVCSLRSFQVCMDAFEMNIAWFLLEIVRGSLPTALGAGQDSFQTLILLFDIVSVVIVVWR
jgi:hypothetical protein